MGAGLRRSFIGGGAGLRRSKTGGKKTRKSTRRVKKSKTSRRSKTRRVKKAGGQIDAAMNRPKKGDCVKQGMGLRGSYTFESMDLNNQIYVKDKDDNVLGPYPAHEWNTCMVKGGKKSKRRTRRRTRKH